MSVYSNKITKCAGDQSGNSGHLAYRAFGLSARNMGTCMHTHTHTQQTETPGVPEGSPEGTLCTRT